MDARRAANSLAILAQMLGLTTPRGGCSQVMRRSAVKHATAGGTPRKSSGGTTRKSGGATGIELDGKLLSLPHQEGQNVVLLLLRWFILPSPLLHWWHLVLLLELMLLSPLLHLRHLVLLPRLLLLRPLLSLWHLVLLGLAYQKERNLILLGNMQLLGPLLDLRHLVLLPWFMLLSLLLHL